MGLLHAEIVKERIERESNLDILLTMPHVLYEEGDSGIKEPYIELTIYSPKDYVGAIINLCETKKGNMLNLSYYQNSAILKYELPYTMLVRGLSSDLKSISSGYATIDYELAGFRQADLVDLRILINGVDIDVLSEKVYRDEAMFLAREKTKKLKEALPKQQFRQIIQAAISGNIVAREEVPAFRKDVLSKMSGGDRTRKDKLLDKQKKGKQKLLVDARVTIPQEVLFSMIRS
ncbi:MAG: Elongation factor 4 [Candidatus Levybacteria bacterium GW2011_GWA1_39_34]|nr:MAG: Elongation factor 4 [Candidatus Levybacteria bacterium GW2011_GWA1_39_34]